MGLPLVVDIAIGLIFIYLILSLLASEVQEVITTIFQWRAKHLQESIQTLLTGDMDEDDSTLTPEQKEVLMKARGLTSKLYGHPLIKGLNYQKTGKVASTLRKITQIFSKLLGQDAKFSGPSKIPSDTFASGILETLRIDQIVRELNEEKVDGFRDRISEAVDQACAHIDDLDPRDPRVPQSVRASLNEEKMNALLGIVVDEFVSKQIPLNVAFNRLYNHLVEYIQAAKQIPDPEIRKLFVGEFRTIKDEIYIEEQQAIWLDNTQVTVVQVVRAYRDLKEAYYDPNSAIAQKINALEAKFGAADPTNDSIYKAIAEKREEIRTIEYQITKTRREIKTLQRENPNLAEKLKQDVQTLTQDSQTRRQELKELERLKLPYKVRRIVYRFVGQDPAALKEFFDGLPINLMNSMSAIAEQTQATIADKIEDVEEDLTKFRAGVEKWFDNGMERANGVFKRNAKGFAFILGVVIAIAANVDTFYMVDRLSTDSELRASLVSKAEETAAQEEAPTTSQELGGVKGQGLPIGWEAENTNKQLLYRMSVRPEDEPKIESMFNTNAETGKLELKNPDGVSKKKRIWGWMKQAAGWTISGVAISMGAPFWFELLNKIVDLKNVGSGKSEKSSG